MGTGIDLAKSINPEHAQALENMRDQLLIVFVKKLGGKITVSAKEIDDTGSDNMLMSVNNGVFKFKLEKKH